MMTGYGCGCIVHVLTGTGWWCIMTGYGQIHVHVHVLTCGTSRAFQHGRLPII